MLDTPIEYVIRNVRNMKNKFRAIPFRKATSAWWNEAQNETSSCMGCVTSIYRLWVMYRTIVHRWINKNTQRYHITTRKTPQVTMCAWLSDQIGLFLHYPVVKFKNVRCQKFIGASSAIRRHKRMLYNVEHFPHCVILNSFISNATS
jgi:hypothetical protein